MRIQMTGTKAKFNGELNDIRLKTEIEVKIEKKKTTFGRENLEELQQNLTIRQEKMHSMTMQIISTNAEFKG